MVKEIVKLRLTRLFVRRVVEELELRPRLIPDETALKKTLVLALGQVVRTANARELKIELPPSAQIALAGIIAESLPKWRDERTRPWNDPAERARAVGTLRQAERVLDELGSGRVGAPA